MTKNNVLRSRSQNFGQKWSKKGPGAKKNNFGSATLKKPEFFYFLLIYAPFLLLLTGQWWKRWTSSCSTTVSRVTPDRLDALLLHLTRDLGIEEKSNVNVVNMTVFIQILVILLIHLQYLDSSSVHNLVPYLVSCLGAEPLDEVPHLLL